MINTLLPSGGKEMYDAEISVDSRPCFTLGNSDFSMMKATGLSRKKQWLLHQARSANTSRIFSMAQSMSGFVITRGGANRMVQVWVSLHRMPFC